MQQAFIMNSNDMHTEHIQKKIFENDA